MADKKTDKIDKELLKSLKEEISMSKKLNEDELEPILRENLARYTGRYIPNFGANWNINLNEVYPIIQQQIPSIFFRNPRAYLHPRQKTYLAKQRDPLSGKMVEVEMDSTKSARTQEGILNYEVMKMGYKKEAKKVLLDALLFPYGVMWHGYKGEFGMTEEQDIMVRNDKPYVKRLSPMHFIHDPAVTMSDIDEGKWQGRIIHVPLRDILEDDKLDVDKEKIKGFMGFGNEVGTREAQGADTIVPHRRTPRTLIDTTSADFRNSIDSKFVEVYEIFKRPTKKEKREGKNGWILLLTNEQEKPLRISEWVIKAEGNPGKVLEFNTLNDAMFGLSDPEVYANTVDQKNAVINQQLQNAQETGKTWVGLSKEASDEEDIQAAQQGQNTIITFDSGNPRDRMFVASANGGGSSELYSLDGRIQQNLDNQSGVSDLKRGVLRSGEESATSVKQRAAGGAARPASRQDIMSDFLVSSYSYINDMNRQFMPMKEAVRIIGSLELQWTENPTKEDIQADVDIEIDVVSMLPENPQEEVQNLTQVLQLMINGIADPAISNKLLQENRMINISPVVEQLLFRLKIKDPEIFRPIEAKESQGFVSIQQVRQAKENVNAALTGQGQVVPPQPDDDHRAKLEIYTTISDLLKKANQQSDVLEQLIQVHMALLQEIESKQAKAGRPAPQLKQPTIKTV